MHVRMHELLHVHGHANLCRVYALVLDTMSLFEHACYFSEFVEALELPREPHKFGVEHEICGQGQPTFVGESPLGGHGMRGGGGVVGVWLRFLFK